MTNLAMDFEITAATRASRVQGREAAKHARSIKRIEENVAKRNQKHRKRTVKRKAIIINVLRRPVITKIPSRLSIT